MDFNDLTEEQKKKVESCRTMEDLVELAMSEGVELSDEQVSSIAGGNAEWYVCTTFTVVGW